MQYVLVNKLRNNLVEKIVLIDGGNTFNPKVYPSYLIGIEDSEGAIDNCNYRYDFEKQEFIPITKDRELLEQEVLRLREENLELKLALAEIAESL